MKCFTKRRLLIALSAANLMSVSSYALASSFQLWEQDAASIGLYHAGYAAWANDASTAFYNPAGMTLIKDQQLVVAGVGVMTDFKFNGNVIVNTIDPDLSIPTSSQGGNFSFIPAIHYVAPLSDRVVFGFSVDVPFGLKTNYGAGTALRYVATLTSANVIDISPSFAIQLTPRGSVGVGFDIQRMFAEFDQYGTLDGLLNATGTNKINDTAYGYHLGWLYQFTPTTRVGISYHSQVVHHLSGNSKFVGDLADFLNDGNPIIANYSTIKMTLPAYTAVSFYHLACPRLAVMGTIVYTQWNVLRQLVFNDFAGAVFPGPTPSTTIQVVSPQYYRNTWNFSLGANYFATDKISLRFGVGYDETPISNTYRNVLLPDNNRYVIALGGHYQATKAIGLDLGWSHFFMQKAHVNPPPLALGAQVVSTPGHVTGGADVLGAQVTWNM